MTPIRVAILDDHQGIIDGYRYRLEKLLGLEVIITAHTGSELEAKLAAARRVGQPARVLLLDLRVPATPERLGDYPIFYAIPRLLKTFPELVILVVSALAEPSLVQAVLQVGAKGYIVKGDAEAYQALGAVISQAANGSLYLSPSAAEAAHGSRRGEGQALLSKRELQVLSLVAAYPGETGAALCQLLYISHSTWRNTLTHIYDKLGVSSKAEAVIAARRRGLLPAEEPEGLGRA